MTALCYFRMLLFRKKQRHGTLKTDMSAENQNLSTQNIPIFLLSLRIELSVFSLKFKERIFARSRFVASE